MSPPSGAHRARRESRLDGWLEGAWLVGNVAGFILLGCEVANHAEASQPPLALEKPETAPDAAES